jgi:uncharacterized protein with PIN domain
MMGYDTRFFNGEDDAHMVAMARKEGRVILTKDTQIMVRRVVTTGQVRAILINSDKPEAQMRQVVATLDLDPQHNPFSICLECNQPLVERSKDEVKDQVPPYVFKTQNQYMQCPSCHRIYWRGTHWRAMHQKLLGFLKDLD